MKAKFVSHETKIFHQKENQQMTNNFQEGQAKNNETQNQGQVQEAKTVVNGKVVPLSQAQQMEQQAAQQATQTGIQAQHDNNTQAVQAGQVASGAQPMEDEALRIKQGNVQSGQMNQSQFGYENNGGTPDTTSVQEQLQQQAEQAQQEAKAKAAAKTTKKAD